MSTPYAKPLPTLNDLNRPFWDGAKQGELKLQRCDDCGHVRYPIQIVCPQCLSDNATWTKVSGRGAVYSCLTFHQVYNKAFANDVPYNVSLIQLDEGPRMYSNVIGVPTHQVKVGDVVQVCFDAVTEDITIPRFKHVNPPQA